MQFLDLTSGLRVAVFVAVNDWFWPNFTIYTSTRLWHSPYFEWQVKPRPSRLLPYKHPLTGGSRPGNDIRENDLSGGKVRWSLTA